jgi:hypothetical protein
MVGVKGWNTMEDFNSFMMNGSVEWVGYGWKKLS